MSHRNSIGAVACNAVHTLRTAAPNVRARTLSAVDVANGIRQHLKRARRTAEGETTHSQLTGGYVHVTYAYASTSEADWVYIHGRRMSDLRVTAERSRAARRENTLGERLETYVCSPGGDPRRETR